VKQSLINYSIPAFGTFDLETDGTESLQTGSIIVISNRGVQSLLEGSIVYRLFGFRTSVLDAKGQATNQVYVSLTPDERGGVAILNPSSTETANLLINLVDDTGVDQDTQSISLGPLEQLSVYVDEPPLFDRLFDQRTTPSEFKGTMNIGSDLEVAVIGLIQDTHDLSLISTATSQTGKFATPAPAALCGCSATIDTINPDRVKVRYGLEGAEADTYQGDNRLRFEYLNGTTPISLPSVGLTNVAIVACGQNMFYATALGSFPQANGVRLTMTKLDGSDPIQCTAQFGD
jgi:hypothetical protein